LSALVIPCSP